MQSLQSQLKVLEASATSPLALVPLARGLETEGMGLDKVIGYLKSAYPVNDAQMSRFSGFTKSHTMA